MSGSRPRTCAGTSQWDVLIAGAGPAGLSAALVLGRACRTVLLCDTGTPRWEIRGGRVAVYGKGQRGFEMARALAALSEDILLCTDGRSGLSPSMRSALERNGIRLCEERISRLEGTRGQLEAIAFQSGRRERRTTLFFNTPSGEQSRLAQSLGCQFTTSGGIRCGQYEATSVPGVFVAGNSIRDVQTRDRGSCRRHSSSFWH